MNLKTLCLGLLDLQEATGYDIKQMFEQSLNHFHAASYGSIYPALKQLEQEGFVKSRVEAGDRHPDKRLFSLTDAGRKHFIEALAETEPAESIKSEFLVQMFFAHLLEPAQVDEKLEQMYNIFDSKLAYLESLSGQAMSPGMRFTLDFGIAAIRAKRDFIHSHRNRLLAEHRTGQEETPGD
jgi:DNA-binding PadR family transcriptional regulator